MVRQDLVGRRAVVAQAGGLGSLLGDRFQGFRVDFDDGVLADLALFRLVGLLSLLFFRADVHLIHGFHAGRWIS